MLNTLFTTVGCDWKKTAPRVEVFENNPWLFNWRKGNIIKLTYFICAVVQSQGHSLLAIRAALLNDMMHMNAIVLSVASLNEV